MKAPFQAYGAGDEALDNDYSSTTERLGQRSLERRLVFKEPEFETIKFEHIKGRYFLYPDLCSIFINLLGLIPSLHIT